MMEAILHKWHGLSLRWRIAISVIAVSVILLLGSSAVQAGQRWVFSRAERAAERRIRAAEDRARIAEGKAMIAEAIVKEKNAQLAQATERAQAAEAALLAARNVTVKVRGEYDQIRNRDLSAVPVDMRRLCAGLDKLYPQNKPCMR